jgi:serine/threonine protein kinase
VWSDAQLRAGDAWCAQIESQLAACSVAVLLVSPNFLASTFIAERELPLILARARAGTLRIVWIPIALDRATLVQQRPALAEIQGGLGFHLALPARPQDSPATALEAVRQHVAQQLQAAVDPLGADLAQRLSQRYDVQRRLGEGNRAVVYRAYDPQLKRLVAIKALKDLRQREAFQGDVEDALRTSEEANFLNIYDAAYGGNAAYCVVQHIQGQSLRAHLQAWAQPGGQTPDADTLRKTFVKLLRAIERAHALGLRYGNLKPSNIVLDERFEPFILPVGRRASTGRANPGLVAMVQRLASAGVPDPHDQEDLAYLVPEHLAAVDPTPDAALADQYMLGLLAHEMATGHLPLRVADPALLLAPGIDALAPLPPVAAQRPLFPERLQAMITRMTALDPAERYADLAEVLAEPDLHDDYSLVLARDSYRRCTRAEGFDTTFFADFYSLLQTHLPATRPHLARIDGPERWQRQHHMLKQAVLLLFAFAQRKHDRREPNLLSHIAGTHASIPAGLFAPFLKVLAALVCGDKAHGIPPRDPLCQRDDLARVLRQQWAQALQPGIDHLTSAALARDQASSF